MNKLTTSLLIPRAQANMYPFNKSEDNVSTCDETTPNYCFPNGCGTGEGGADDNQCTAPTGDTPKALCCKDFNGDGTIGLDDSGNSECVGALLNTTLCAAGPPYEESCYYCDDATYSLDSLLCIGYEDEWVFNIADLVNYYWETLSTGGFKLAQVRFYPVADQV